MDVTGDAAVNNKLTVGGASMNNDVSIEGTLHVKGQKLILLNIITNTLQVLIQPITH